ncbi:hypothetical protein CSKR_110932 [Clonorchis sinensis]|uniref:Uncharacterized protein n=1 Tax=Clonorchis sinensis TaxID=79923 RepID=A0A419PEK0_CLOSI|nr:hypothetical protein CSKR_110932 [Clonorchis sinensis]
MLNVLLIRLLKILRQPTTGFALLGAHQVGAVPENITNGRFSWVPGESLAKKQIDLQMSVFLEQQSNLGSKSGVEYKVRQILKNLIHLATRPG